MQYLSTIPQVASIMNDDKDIQLDLETKTVILPPRPNDPPDDPVVFLGNYGGQIIVVVGRVLEFKEIKQGSRLTMQGSIVQFSI
jgi:hypothetical protein